MSEISKCSKRIIDAIKLGFTVGKKGEVYSHRGTLLKQRLDKHGYFFVSARVYPRSVYRHSINIPVHRLIAFIKFGEEAVLKEGIQVRHLDDNSKNNSFNNIGLGTQSDNMMDRPKEKRVRMARSASKQRKSAMSDEKIRSLREDHESGMSYNSLSAKYGISKSTISFHCSKKAKRMAIRDE